MQNPQFDFLNPSHTLFSYFTKLVDMYARIIEGAPDLRVKIDKRTDPEYVLKKLCKDGTGCVRRSGARWRRRRGNCSLLVDWKDFTVVETITFDQDELREATTSIGAVAAANEAQIEPVTREVARDEGHDNGADVHKQVDVQDEQLHVVDDYQHGLQSKGLIT